MRLLILLPLLLSAGLLFSQTDSIVNADSITFVLAPKPGKIKSDTDTSCYPVYCANGIASYYGRAFQGRYTSSGERFDMNKYTAAHKSLPFGTWLIVTNLKNGKAVLVKVNDRMPQSNKREIDLSYIAARDLGFVSAGLAHVQLEIYLPPKK